MSTEHPNDVWPPRVDEPLPRAIDAYAEDKKLAWILSDEGHGREWARVLRSEPGDIVWFWNEIRKAVVDSAVSSVRDIHPYGINCEVRVEIALRDRVTQASTVWHYLRPTDVPRLATAYPIH